MPTRDLILQQALAATCEDRNAAYGPPEFQLHAAESLMDLLLGRRDAALQFLNMRPMCPVEIQAARMVCVKLSRIFCGPIFTADSYVDLAAYAAIMGEAAARSHLLEEKAREEKAQDEFKIEGNNFIRTSK